MRSTSPSSSQFPVRLTEGNVELPGRSQALHSRQASQNYLIMFRRTLSKPNFSRIRLILGPSHDATVGAVYGVPS
eukprot:4101831-Pyramimonas_sp.AAC.1